MDPKGERSMSKFKTACGQQMHKKGSRPITILKSVLISIMIYLVLLCLFALLVEKGSLPLKLAKSLSLGAFTAAEFAGCLFAGMQFDHSKLPYLLIEALVFFLIVFLSACLLRDGQQKIRVLPLVIITIASALGCSMLRTGKKSFRIA